MKKLLIISPSLKVGGIERALTVLASEFVKFNIEVHFLPCLPTQQYYHLDERVNLIWPAIPYHKERLGKLFFYTNIVRFIRNTINSLQPDAILSFGDAFNPLTLLAALGTNSKVYISDRTSPTFGVNPIAKVLKRWLYPKSSGFIAQTEVMANHQRMQFGNKLTIKIIPNAIQQVEQFENSINRKNSILYVGRLSWEKGVDRLINAFLLVESNDWTLDIVGEGPEMGKLKALATKSPKNKHIIFHGQQINPTPFYLSSTIFVLPSHVEGFPNALCEAMSAGLAAVCFDSIPYQKIIIPYETGLVAKNDDVKQLSKQMDKLINDEKLRKKLGQQAAEHIKQFDKEYIAKEFLAFMKLNHE